MSLSRLVWALALLALVGAAVSCGGKGACGPGQCHGCCDSTGACVAGELAAACGGGGLACQTCLPGQACQSGQCAAADADAGTCGPASCPGCCANGSCQPGTADQACGVNGASCATCPAAERCAGSGTCQPAQFCTGCFDESAGCRAGDSNVACGTGGAQCRICTAGTACRQGACQSVTADAGVDSGVDAGTDAGPGVDAGTDAGRSLDAGVDAGPGMDAGFDGGCALNCAGCCSGQTCVPFSGQSVSQCGASGAACASCGGGQSCLGGVCQGCTGVDRCRQSDGTCAMASASSCGGNGANCVDCTQQIFAVECGWTTKSCTTAGFDGMGSSCDTDSACFPGANSGSPYCRGLWPEGYCEDLCDTAGNQIGKCTFPNGFCLPTYALDGGDWAGVCLRGCTAASDCGHDAGVYLCDRVGNGLLGYCVPACQATQDCRGWLGDSRADCLTSTHQCCGLKNFACCAGNRCFDGSSCSLGYCG